MKIFEHLKAYCERRFNRYTADGAEHYFNEGYYRGWLDKQIGNECDPQCDTWDVPKPYQDDYIHGYNDGCADSESEINDRKIKNAYISKLDKELDF